MLNLITGYKGELLIKQVEQYHRLFQNQVEPALSLFFRISIYRMGLALILVAMIRLIGNYYLFYPLLFLAGTALGYTLSLLTYCFGMSGVTCLVVYMFPQGLIYIPLLLGVLRETSFNMNRVLPWDFRRFTVIFGLIFLGCVAESVINPIILKCFLKTFL